MAGGVLVSKHGAGAVLVPAPEAKDPEDGGAAYAIAPGVVVKGEVARLARPGLSEVH